MDPGGIERRGGPGHLPGRVGLENSVGNAVGYGEDVADVGGQSIWRTQGHVVGTVAGQFVERQLSCLLGEVLKRQKLHAFCGVQSKQDIGSFLDLDLSAVVLDCHTVRAGRVADVVWWVGDGQVSVHNERDQYERGEGAHGH
ncbi:MAG: hypothetical protein JKY23_04415 [Nitrospinaceae bacterium]|nr:hypothetical protein [Nitrospinaceae bacterium]